MSDPSSPKEVTDFRVTETRIKTVSKLRYIALSLEGRFCVFEWLLVGVRYTTVPTSRIMPGDFECFQIEESLLKQRRRRRQRERQKRNRFYWQNNNFTCALSLHDYNVRVTETKDDNFPFLFLNFDTVLSNSTPKQFTNIWRIKRDGITAITFKAAQIHCPAPAREIACILGNYPSFPPLP